MKIRPIRHVKIFDISDLEVIIHGGSTVLDILPTQSFDWCEYNKKRERREGQETCVTQYKTFLDNRRGEIPSLIHEARRQSRLEMHVRRGKQLEYNYRP